MSGAGARQHAGGFVIGHKVEKCAVVGHLCVCAKPLNGIGQMLCIRVRLVLRRHIAAALVAVKARVIEVDADSTPWGDVDEGGEFGEEETPNLKQIKYAIKKKGGILKTTRELLQDTAVNILAYLNKWIAKKSRATRNAAILNVINTITKGKEVAVATFDDFKDVFNVKLDPAIAVSSIVLTNQDGFNYMDKLKDKDGKYIRKERYSGSCSRSFYVGDAVTQDDVKAKFENGVLTLEVPKKEEAPKVEEKKYISIEG